VDFFAGPTASAVWVVLVTVASLTGERTPAAMWRRWCEARALARMEATAEWRCEASGLRVMVTRGDGDAGKEGTGATTTGPAPPGMVCAGTCWSDGWRSRAVSAVDAAGTTAVISGGGALAHTGGGGGGGGEYELAGGGKALGGEEACVSARGGAVETAARAVPAATAAAAVVVAVVPVTSAVVGVAAVEGA